MPEFGGLRVVKATGIDGLADGDLIPWQRVDFRRHQGGVSVFITPDEGNRTTAGVRGGARGRRLVTRLKSRWTGMTDSDPLVCYELERESVRAFLWGFWSFGGILIALGLYLSIAVAQQFGSLPWSAFRWIAFVFANFHAWLVIITLWLFWRMRPRNPQFHRVALSEVGLSMEGGEAPPVDIEWTEVVACKHVRSDPLRVRLDLVDGRRVWLVVPKRVQQDVFRRLPVAFGGIQAGRSSWHRRDLRLPVRLLLIGLFGAGGYLGILFWLINAGLLLPADFRRMAVFGVTMFILCTWYPGLALLWIGWRSTPKGRRTVRRWTKRVGTACRSRTG